MSETQSDLYGDENAARAFRTSIPALVIVMNSDDLAQPPSRHLLDGVDVVSFERGSRAVIRDHFEGAARMIVRIPDPVMSAQHGRLLRVQNRWMLDDPKSKNGAVIAGLPSRCGMIEPGDLFELGHTLFLLESVPLHQPPAQESVLATDDVLASLHPDLVAARDALTAIARSAVPIILIGETGTGKEVYAQAIHTQSQREGPLIAVNCGALSASLLEAELFGHRRGAFSGATSDRPGFVRSAHGGTLFLDEIGELSQAGQVALLRVLQEREVIPVGDSQPVAVDIRVCVASQRPLQEEVESGRFRSDLYARLLGYQLHLPPLRERPFDIGALMRRLLLRIDPDHATALTPAAARALVSYEWPRNIRELERCLATAVVLARGRTIDTEHLPDVVQRARVGRVRVRTPAPPAPMLVTNDDPDGELRTQLAAKLVEHRGNISAVARDLGKHREQVNRWLRRFGFDPDVFRR